MSVETFDPGTIKITATAPAVAHLRAQLTQAHRPAVRLALKESGCNGYMYDLDYVDAPTDSDTAVEVADDLTVFVAAEHVALLAGTEIDYVTEGLNSSLKFRNPNAESECGCGESFAVDDS